MISRTRLLAGLNEIIFVEEGMTTLFANFAKELVSFAPDIKEDDKKEMVKLLSRLHRDSSRHKETVDRLIRQIEGPQR